MSYFGLYWLFGIPFFIVAYAYQQVKIEKEDLTIVDLIMMIMISIIPIMREFVLGYLYSDKLLTYTLIKARK